MHRHAYICISKKLVQWVLYSLMLAIVAVVPLCCLLLKSRCVSPHCICVISKLVLETIKWHIQINVCHCNILFSLFFLKSRQMETFIAQYITIFYFHFLLLVKIWCKMKMAYTWPIYCRKRTRRKFCCKVVCSSKTFLKFKFVEAYLVFEIWDGFT